MSRRKEFTDAYQRVIDDPESGWQAYGNPATGMHHVVFEIEKTTPEWAISTKRWPFATYRMIVLLWITSGKPVLWLSTAPWMASLDNTISYQRAIEILNDPESATPRQPTSNR